MGRPRSFDERAVVAAAAAAFCRLGYEEASVDDLCRATGLLRGSLYQAFGSKRGLFLAALATVPAPAPPASDGSAGSTSGEAGLDLVLVAALELAPRDEQVRDLLARHLAPRLAAGDAALALGRRLLVRAGLSHTPTPRED